jgi:hypothetical protein
MYALYHNTTGNYNTAVGDTALQPNTIGAQNSALGFQALSGNTTGGNNTAVGFNSLLNNTIGSDNTVVGSDALDQNTTGGSNTVIGFGVASVTQKTGSNNILIGTSSAVDVPSDPTNNFLNIGNAIFATGMTGTLSAPAGNVGIGTTAPAAKLHVLSGGGVGSPAPSFGSSDLMVIQNNAAEYAGVNLDLVSDFFGVSTLNFDAYGSGASGNANIEYAAQYGQLRFNFASALGMMFWIYGNNFGLEIGAGGACGSEMLAICPQNGSETNDYFSISSSTDGDKFMVKKSGNVGIGTASPSAPLHVKYGSANSTVYAPVLMLDNPSGGQQTVQYFDINGSVEASIRADYVGDLLLNANGGTLYLGYTDLSSAPPINFQGGKVYFDSTGHVGIGSATPNTNLDVGSGYFEWGGQSRVTSDFGVTNSASLTAITGLSATLTAGKTYYFELTLYLTDNATYGVQADLGGGAATATNLIAEGVLMDSTTVKTSTRSASLTTVLCSSTTTSATDLTCHITGTITVNAGGTFIPRFAENTAHGGSTATVKQGSIMTLHQIN